MNRTEELQKVQQERIDARKKAAEEHRARAKEQAAKEAEAQHARTELERQREQEQEARDLQRMTNGLWLDYLATPGATEEDFKAALPDLLEQHRRELTTNRQK